MHFALESYIISYNGEILALLHTTDWLSFTWFIQASVR